MLAAWLGVGALVGAVGAVAAQVGPSWAAPLVHYAIPYVLLIALIGATAPRAGVAALRAVGCFVAFVLAYYGVVALQFGTIPVRYAAAWLVAAVTVCPVAAIAVRWAVRRSGVLPATVLAAGGAVALSDGSVGNLVRFAVFRLDPSEVQPVVFVNGAVGLAVAAVLVLVLPRDRRTRVVAAVVVVPLAVISTVVGWALHFGVGPYL